MADQLMGVDTSAFVKLVIRSTGNGWSCISKRLFLAEKRFITNHPVECFTLLDELSPIANVNPTVAGDS
jgi:hypothetical protein